MPFFAKRLASEMVKKIREEDLEQTRSGLFTRKSLAIMTNLSFLISSVLFQRAKMIISVLVTWIIVDRNLAVRVLLSF